MWTVRIITAFILHSLDTDRTYAGHSQKPCGLYCPSLLYHACTLEDFLHRVQPLHLGRCPVRVHERNLGHLVLILGHAA